MSKWAHLFTVCTDEEKKQHAKSNPHRVGGKEKRTRTSQAPRSVVDRKRRNNRGKQPLRTKDEASKMLTLALRAI